MNMAKMIKVGNEKLLLLRSDGDDAAILDAYNWKIVIEVLYGADKSCVSCIKYCILYCSSWPRLGSSQSRS